MKLLDRRTAGATVRLTIFVVVTVLATALLAITIGNISFGATNGYQAVFTEATGVVEGDDVEFTVRVSPAPLAGVEVSVPWKVGSATGTAVLTADEQSAVVSVPTTDDSEVEAPEPVKLELGELVATDGRMVVLGEVEPSFVTDNDQAEDGNQAPVVSAGPAASGLEGAHIALAGTVEDDAPGVTAQWSVTGPCTVRYTSKVTESPPRTRMVSVRFLTAVAGASR